MSSVTFKGGVHPFEHKELTADKAIETMPLPKNVSIPLLQHIGAPCEPLVKINDTVKVGQPIGKAVGNISSPIHASISGVVKKVEFREVASGGKCICIDIEGDGLNEWYQPDVKRDLEQLSAEDIVQLMQDCGLVGLGGAGFPTHVKYSVPEGAKIETVIINGAECEPYLTCDYRLMLEEGEGVVAGLRAMMKAVNASKGIIAIEDNKPEAIRKMQELSAGYSGLSVVVLKTKYPQGGEKQLIKAVLNKEVPSGKLPMHVETLVSNVHTAYSLGKMLENGQPLIERVVTISGHGMKDPKNLRVRIGTMFSELVDYCGGMTEDTEKFVLSAPMTGFAQYRLDLPAEKRIAGAVALTADQVDHNPETPCIRCGKCVEACPMGLLPNKLDTLLRLNKLEEAKDYHILDCIECSSCAYICPAHRMLTQSFSGGKLKVRAMSQD